MNSGSSRVDSLWKGRLTLGDQWAIWRGEIGDGARHRHFAAQAIFSDSPVHVLDADGENVHAHCVLIDPLTFHRVQPGQHALLVYVEPASWFSDYIEELLSNARTASSLAVISSPSGPHYWDAWLSQQNVSRTTPGGRLVDALRYIEDALPSGAVLLQAAAARSALSPDRFRHIFTEQLGLPFKRYVLWRRLRLAASEMMSGADLTTAAHSAGFSDAAHLARTLKSTFGITASQALRPVEAHSG